MPDTKPHQRIQNESQIVRVKILLSFYFSISWTHTFQHSKLVYHMLKLKQTGDSIL